MIFVRMLTKPQLLSAAVWVGAYTLLLGLPSVASEFTLTNIVGKACILGLSALSLTVLAGYGGMISLSQAAIAGTAGYTIAMLGKNSTGAVALGWSWYATVPAALIASATLSVFIGFLSRRTMGIQTIMITLAAAVAMYYFTLQNRLIFNGSTGYSGVQAPILAGVNFRDPKPFYYLCISLAALWYTVVAYCERSAFGLALQGVRDNERRMRSAGFHVVAHKLSAWAVSGIAAGSAGILLVWYNGRVSPGTINIPAEINILVVAILGGLTRPVGAFLGALVFVLLQTFAIDVAGAERFDTLIGLVFLAIVFWSPDGILGIADGVRARLPRYCLQGSAPERKAVTKMDDTNLSQGEMT